MLRIICVACAVLVSVVGCSNEQEERKIEQEKLMKRFLHQEYDHRSLEEKIRDAQQRKKEKQNQTSQEGKP